LLLPKDTIAPLAPTATPAGGLYSKAQSVTLSNPDATATLRYTTNGVDPTIASTAALGAISVSGTSTLKAIAVDQVGNVSPVSSFAYTIDTTPPSTSLSGGPSGTTSVSDASFGFTSNDAAATFECRFDTATWAACSAPQAYPALADGSHTFSVRAIDSAGNIDPSPPSRTWTVDSAAPDTAITSGPSGTSSGTSATFRFSSNEALASFDCRIDGGGWTACVSPQTLNSLPDGSHTYDVRARDAAGNVDATPESRTWSVDGTAPETTITGAPSGNSGSDVTFEFASSEAGSSYECRRDGGSWSSCTSPLPYVNLSPGAHTFDVRSTDPAGNVDVTPAGKQWTVDNSVGANGNPVGMQINGGALFTNSPLVTVAATPRLGSVDLVRVSNDGGFLTAMTRPIAATGQYAWTLNSSIAERLPKTVYVRFAGAGVDQGETFTDDIILDETSPVVLAANAVSQVGTAASMSKTTTGLRVIARDGTSGVSSMQIASNKRAPGAWKQYKSRVPMRLGSRSLFVRVRDRAGNVSRWHAVRMPKAGKGALVRNAR
jgi:hypothetical protein